MEAEIAVQISFSASACAKSDRVSPWGTDSVPSGREGEESFRLRKGEMITKRHSRLAK
jgi:hypothetical protein